MEDHSIQISHQGRVGLISFNRPNSLNAFNTKLMDATNRAVNQFIEDDQIQCIIINGNGRAFSAGFDMKESAQRNISTDKDWRKVLEEDFDFIMQFWECPKPTIAVAHGHCIGGEYCAPLRNHVRSIKKHLLNLHTNLAQRSAAMSRCQ